MAAGNQVITPPSNQQTPTFLRFAFIGACGGLCAFVFSQLLGIGPLIKKPWYLDLPGEMLLGACAALFGIYLLTASDLTKPQTMAFALACGFSWSPIVTAAQAYTKQHTDNQTVESAKDASGIAKQISVQAGAQADNTKKEASSQISNALEKLPSISTSASREEILTSSKSVVTSFPSAQADSTSIEALKSIGLASVKADAPQVSIATFDKLKDIASNSPVPSTRSEAHQAALTLANASPAIPNDALKPASALQ